MITQIISTPPPTFLQPNRPFPHAAAAAATPSGEKYAHAAAAITRIRRLATHRLPRAPSPLITHSTWKKAKAPSRILHRLDASVLYNPIKPTLPRHPQYYIRYTKYELRILNRIELLSQPRLLSSSRLLVHRTRCSRLIQLLREQTQLFRRTLGVPFFQSRLKMLNLRLDLALTSTVDGVTLGVLFNSLFR